MVPVWDVLMVIVCHLIVAMPGEEFISEDTSQKWTIPDVSYPDPTFIRNIRPTTEVISSQGFPVETHYIQTEDGYILTLHRIPGKGIPVLLQHGLISTSDQWFFRNDSTADLPFILSKCGFDVWLGNFRGNVYSRHHATISPDSLEFWNFSLHEYASRDLPAMIELVRHRSGYNRLIFIGYSIGGGVPYMLADSRPEYTQYIQLNILFAPFVYGPQNLKSVLVKNLKSFINFRIESALKSRTLNAVEVVAKTNRTISILFSLCGERSMTVSMCRTLVEYFIGKATSKNFSNKNLARILVYIQGGTSAKAFYHAWSIYKSNRFLKFDSLPINLRNGQLQEYDVTKMTIPTIIWYSRSDSLVEPASAEKLAYLTPNVVHLNRISHKLFNHYDFWVHEDINQIIHFKLMDQLKAFLKSNNDHPETQDLK